ncbi:hypothetical protein G5C51_00840 [Streptomyces sp. A7024]|uniref:Uncharacterized protein n=1 Tax=Streptomyces coryli TaxID=1128680 RepID=A0A6G4TTM9_9ACTN|nr:hypothetical protein [Streptomyces coryli]NGN62458.1 hypothetical protein [Streptomyces coryli]
MSPKVTRLLWRWRPNPLKRRSDRVEAWTVLLTGVLLIAGGTAVGAATASLAHGRLIEQQQTRRPTQAVLLEAAKAEPAPAAVAGVDASGGRGDLVRVAVRWTDAGGVTHRGTAPVTAGGAVGEQARIWTVDDGRRVVPAPPTSGQAIAQAISFGVVAALLFGVLMLLIRLSVQHRINERRTLLWEREWERVGPQWSRRRT